MLTVICFALLCFLDLPLFSLGFWLWFNWIFYMDLVWHCFLFAFCFVFCLVHFHILCGCFFALFFAVVVLSEVIFSFFCFLFLFGFGFI